MKLSPVPPDNTYEEMLAAALTNAKMIRHEGKEDTMTD